MCVSEGSFLQVVFIIDMCPTHIVPEPDIHVLEQDQINKPSQKLSSFKLFSLHFKCCPDIFHVGEVPKAINGFNELLVLAHNKVTFSIFTISPSELYAPKE